MNNRGDVPFMFSNKNSDLQDWHSKIGGRLF